jgi:hypothetical protein
VNDILDLAAGDQNVEFKTEDGIVLTGHLGFPKPNPKMVDIFVQLPLENCYEKYPDVPLDNIRPAKRKSPEQNVDFFDDLTRTGQLYAIMQEYPADTFIPMTDIVAWYKNHGEHSRTIDLISAALTKFTKHHPGYLVRGPDRTIQRIPGKSLDLSEFTYIYNRKSKRRRKKPEDDE